MEKLKQYKYWIALVAVLLLFMVLNPTQSQHAQKMASVVTEGESEKEDADVLAKGFTLTLISSLSTYHNYLFFSTCTAENEGESHLVSIGALGYVYNIPQNKDKESE